MTKKVICLQSRTFLSLVFHVFLSVEQLIKKTHFLLLQTVFFSVKYYSPSVTQITALTIFCRYKNDNKNCREMGLLSLSGLEICIKKQNSLVFSLKHDFKGKNFNLGQLKVYKWMFALELSMKK